MALNQTLRAAIETTPVLVYSKTWCGYDRAKFQFSLFADYCGKILQLGERDFRRDENSRNRCGTRCCSYVTAFVTDSVILIPLLSANGGEIQSELTKITGGHRTVPMVFVNGKFIGGCDGTYCAQSHSMSRSSLFSFVDRFFVLILSADTLRKQRSGELRKLLDSAGVGSAA